MNDIVSIRNVERDDLPRIYEFQLDPESNRVAVTTPRSAESFAAHWDNALQDPNVTAKGILVGDQLAGCISCFKMDELDAVGYWLGRPFLGRGIASRALELLLTEVTIRPVFGNVCTPRHIGMTMIGGWWPVRHFLNHGEQIWSNGHGERWKTVNHSHV